MNQKANIEEGGYTVLSLEEAMRKTSFSNDWLTLRVLDGTLGTSSLP
jgi:hypothetical protein